MKKTIRQRSGNIHDTRKLVCFLYLLMRDELPCGTIEKIVAVIDNVKPFPTEYSNGWLAKYAKDVATRLQ